MALVPSPGHSITFEFNLKQWIYSQPATWSASDPDSHFHVHYCGNGENTVEKAYLVGPASWLKDGGTWNGLVYKNNGTIAKIAMLICPNHSSATGYALTLDHVVDTIGIPTTGDDAWKRFSVSGLSGGPLRWFKTRYSTTNTHSHLFRKRLIMSPQDLTGYPIASEDGNYFDWVWFSNLDTNNGTGETPAWCGSSYYAMCTGRKKITITQQATHSMSIWSPAMAITGLGSPTGGTADTNRWRFLVDPYDGVGLNPIAVEGTGQIV